VKKGCWDCRKDRKMKLEIYDETLRESVAKLRLLQTKDSVALAVVDEDGNPVHHGQLLNIGFDGIIYFCAPIDPKLGFVLDSENRLRTRF
jgi:hypothetical protein